MIDWPAGRVVVMAFLLAGSMLVPNVYAQRVSKVQDTKHNLSTTFNVTDNRTVKAPAGGETEICVFCHTPHGAEDQSTSPTNVPQLKAPLWNKTLGTTKTYTVYTSSSLDAEIIKGGSLEQPLGSSKLCLSCHDGAMALGSVRVLRGAANQTIALDGTDATKMPAGPQGVTTGYTRQLGNLGGKVSGEYDLTNDHPISLTYNTALVNRDGELRTPGADTVGSVNHPLIGTRAGGQGSGIVNLSSPASTRPVLPLEPTGPSGAGQIQCTTCHDPHIKETNLSNEGNIKFLRRHRVQLSQPGNTYDDSKDIICLACHDKGKQGLGGNSWAWSAHANSLVATQTYTANAAALRDFPAGLPVYKASCLNCHDTHTVTGSRRLLREGVSGGGTLDDYGAGAFRSGGSPALEETCYQCHRDPAQSALASTTTVPNIRSDFQLTYHMPITSTEQGAGTEEKHDIGGNFSGEGFGGADCTGGTSKCGADMIESRAKLGITAGNRHAECTDCHNPHRVVKFKNFFGNASGNIANITPDASGTHTHSNSNMVHTNVASGVLRGSWGVEPIYGGGASFHTAPSNYTIRRGDPGERPPITVPNTVSAALTNANIDTETYVTREYQVCLKCHSSYGQNYTIGATGGDGTPLLTGAPRTPIDTNYLRYYTDQAREFQSPDNHRGEPLSVGHNGGAHNDGAAYPTTGTNTTTQAFNSHNFNTNNHRSWHPVMRSTGRTRSSRSMGTSDYPWYKPWSHNGAVDPVGTQTMYCSDCHGSNVGTNGVRGQDGTAVTGGGSVIPGASGAPVEDGPPWGPHGSSNPFILKGVWHKDAVRFTTFNKNTLLCFKCHDPTFYTGASDAGGSGFCCDGRGNLHNYHVNRIRNRSGDNTRELQCSWCHVAVPHGWKNKAFLVNLNDVGSEVGYSGTPKEVSISASSHVYNQGPYYMNAKLKVRNFAASGSWTKDSCNSAGKGTNYRINGSGGSANQIGGGSGKEDRGLEWMQNTCTNPP